MINGDRPKPGPNAGRKARKVGSARARRCFRCARACLLHRRGANSSLKLSVKKLTPEDVYVRVAYGFRKMPAWEGVYTDEELMAITAYVKSDRFSN